MKPPTSSTLFYLRHIVNSCIHFRKSYITQSRATQLAGIKKGFGVEFSMSTLDRAISRGKKWYGVPKTHRSGSVNGNGYLWKSSLTKLTWKLVMFMWRLHLLTGEQFKALKRILGIVKQRGPAKLRAPRAPSERLESADEGDLFGVPT